MPFRWERRLDYVEWTKQVVAGLRGTSPWLEQQFDDAAERAVRSLKASVEGRFLRDQTLYLRSVRYQHSIPARFYGSKINAALGQT